MKVVASDFPVQGLQTHQEGTVPKPVNRPDIQNNVNTCLQGVLIHSESGSSITLRTAAFE